MRGETAVTSRFYRPELDVVRFLAFLLVFFHHTLPRFRNPLRPHLLKSFSASICAVGNACGFGLCLFFVLSSYLIFELLFRESQATGTASVKQFYIRRILRIWPLYYLVLAIGVAVSFLPGFAHVGMMDFAWYAVFLAAWHSCLYNVLKNPASPLWSISVEEQFYLLAPWAVKYLNRKLLYGFCAVLILVANILLYHLGKMRVIDDAIWFNPLVQFEFIAVGLLLCLGLRGRMPRLSAWQRIVLLAASALCWFFACYGLHCRFENLGSDNPGSWALIGGYGLAALGCAMIMIAFLGVQPKVLPGWAIYLGRISFGLYVYHGFALHFVNAFPISQIVSAAVPGHVLGRILNGALRIGPALGLTVLAAVLSYRYFETPFLKMKKRHAVIESQPIAGVR